MGMQRVEVPSFIEKPEQPDLWFDGIQRIETIDGICRMLLFRSRLSSDSILYRQHVATLLCPRAIIPRELRHISMYVLGLDTIAGWSN